MRRITVALGVALACVLGWSATAAAYPLQFLVVTVSDADLDPGQGFDVTVSGCVEGEVVEFRLDASAASALCVAGAPGAPSGAAVARAALTAPTVVGPYVGSVTLESSGDVVPEFTVRVVGPEVVPASIIGPENGSTYDDATVVTLVLFGLLFLLSCSVAYWYLFLRPRDVRPA